MIEKIFALLLVYQAKHYICDYPLQIRWMIGKFRKDWTFLLPLLAHAGVHGLFTLAICLVVAPSLWWLSLFDATIHFFMDRIKAGPKYLGKFKALSAKEFETYFNKLKFAQGSIKIAEEMLAKADGDSGFWKSNIDNAKKDIETSLSAFKGNTYFWWSLGLDAMVHHITHLGICYVLVTHG